MRENHRDVEGKRAASGWLGALAAFLLVHPLVANAELPARPDRDGAVVEDHAKILSADTRTRIEAVQWSLLAERLPPVVVVTVHSLGGRGVEAYARDLFDTWGIGDRQRNRGVLLLIATGDRRARIELGAGWGGGEHGASRQIMDSHIIPAFKRGDFDTGVLDGVRALDAMIRAEPLPPPTPPWWFWPAVVFGAIAVVAIAVSLFRSGRSGWGWAFLIAVGALLVLLMRCAPRGGRSFGGGFSVGGGATGSW